MARSAKSQDRSGDAGTAAASGGGIELDLDAGRASLDRTAAPAATPAPVTARSGRLRPRVRLGQLPRRRRGRRPGRRTRSDENDVAPKQPLSAWTTPTPHAATERGTTGRCADLVRPAVACQGRISTARQLRRPHDVRHATQAGVRRSSRLGAHRRSRARRARAHCTAVATARRAWCAARASSR